MVLHAQDARHSGKLLQKLMLSLFGILIGEIGAEADQICIMLRPAERKVEQRDKKMFGLPVEFNHHIPHGFAFQLDFHFRAMSCTQALLDAVKGDKHNE